MLTAKQKLSLARRWKHYLESLIYVECLSHNIKKTPILEVEDDATAFFDADGNRIHLGVGMIEADSAEDPFQQLHYLLGHALQHMLSTTDKDWQAAHKMCFRNACQRISVRVFGKTRRLSKDSDYQSFFEELAKNNMYVNQNLLTHYIHFVLNTLEDGRIENIRPRLHPGFGNYKKVFRGKRWLKDDFKDETFFKPNPDDLSDLERLKMLMGQIYYLSTLGIYQKGFVEAYGGSKAQKLVQTFIPDISRAVLGKTCKVCMDSGRNVFDRLLDMIIDACTLEASAAEIQKFLEDLLKKLLDEAMNQKLSATPNSEEQGDGIPAPGLFGETELEIEVTQEEYDEIMENAEEAEGGLSVKVKVKEENSEDAEEKSESKSSSGDGDSDESKDKSEDSPSDGNPASSLENTDEGNEGKPSKDGQSEESSDAAGEGEGESIETDPTKTEDGNDSASGDMSSPADESSTVNNRTSESGEKDSKKSEKDFEEELQKQMEEAAAKAKADFDLAEADAKLDEKFSEAAKTLTAVEPKEFDLSRVDTSYAYDVKFVESTRKYDPVGRLPLELENKGKSLEHKIDELVKNKQDPDQRYLKSGMLDTRRLTSLAMGDLSVFKKKGEPHKTDVATFLLMDNSGSMGNGPGSTRFACCNAFAVLEEGFKKHMPLKIAAFDAWDDYSVSHEVIKEFDEVSEPNLSFNFRDLGRSGSGNKDGYSIRVATQQLLARGEKDKILIIASDGFPTEYRGGHTEGCADVKAAVEEARKAGIRTVGMYMFHEQNENDFAEFRNMYGPEIIFASLDEIENELTRILKRYF